MGSNTGPAPEAVPEAAPPALSFGAMAETVLFGALFFPVKVCEKTGVAKLFPGLTESQRTAAEGKHRDYSLVGPETKASVTKGLANGQWFLPHIERKTLRRLMQRDDYHATRDTILLFGLIAGFGYAAYHFWTEGSYGLFSLCFWIYCTLYTSSGDSRWHECGHGTAFKTKWMNDVLYEIASFMVFREPLVWRFSHARHHTDTDIAGRDPEMDGRPLDMWNLFIAFFNVQGIQGECKKIWMHANGSLSPNEKVFVPSPYRTRVFWQARSWLTIYLVAIAVSVYYRSPLPAMYVFLPYSLGAWHFVLTGVFQHASLAHDVLDHRLNTRTCYINPISAFIYWNMHYHVEHHMFPMVPYCTLQPPLCLDLPRKRNHLLHR